MPRWGRSQERSSDQKPSAVLTWTLQKPSPSSSRAYSPRAWHTVLCRSPSPPGGRRRRTRPCAPARPSRRSPRSRAGSSPAARWPACARPPRPRAGAGPGRAACPSPACRARARPSTAAGGPGAPFGDGGRVPLVPRYHVDLVDLDLTPKDHRRELGGEPAAQLLGHELHVGLAQVQLPGDLPVGEVEPHQVEAQDPDPQRLVVPGQDGAGQVVEAGAACRAAVALAARSGVVPAVAGHGGAVAGRAADALGPAVLPDQLVALGVIDQRRQVHQGRGHGRHRSKRADPSSIPVAPVGALGPTTPKPDKSLKRLLISVVRTIRVQAPRTRAVIVSRKIASAWWR